MSVIDILCYDENMEGLTSAFIVTVYGKLMNIAVCNMSKELLNCPVEEYSYQERRDSNWKLIERKAIIYLGGDVDAYSKNNA